MVNYLYSIYNDYFARDKPFRHDVQHLLCACGGFGILHFIFSVPVTGFYSFIFLIFTYATDLDGFYSCFRNRHKIPAAQKIIDSLMKGRFKEASTLATVHHKKFNNLYIHNIIGFFVVLYSLVATLLGVYELLSLIFTAVLTHFIFDWGDDFYQLGHGYNWLWPIMDVERFNHEARHPKQISNNI